MEEAVFNDCRALIKNFAEKGCPSFQSFCAEWRKLSFQHIFTNQTTYIQVQQTTACAFYLGKRIAANCSVTRDNAYNFAECADEQTTLLYRIGALHLLYAIYFKQPLKQYTKIEMSLELWHAIKHFITQLLPADDIKYDDARYIFWKLYQAQAFRFTAHDFCVGLEGLVDYYDLENTKSYSLGHGGAESVSRTLEKHTNFNSLVQTTPALVALEKGYNEMKSELTKLHRLDAKLLPPTNIFQSIRESFEKIEMIIDETDDAGDCASSNSKRRKLKQKAYGEIKHEQSATASISEVDQKKLEQTQKQTKKYNRTCRMSARTIFADKLPDNYDEEDDNDETISDADSVESKQTSKKAFLLAKQPAHEKGATAAAAAKSADNVASKTMESSEAE